MACLPSRFRPRLQHRAKLRTKLTLTKLIVPSHSQPRHPLCLDHDQDRSSSQTNPNLEAWLEADLAALHKRMEELEGEDWQSKAYRMAQLELETPGQLKGQNSKGEDINLLCSTPVFSICQSAQPWWLEPNVPCDTSQAPPQQDVWSRSADLMRQLNAQHDSWLHRCPDCWMKFQIQKDLDRHQKSRHGKT